MKQANPASDQLAWYLEVCNGDPLTRQADEVLRHLVLPPGETYSNFAAGWAHWATRVGHCTIAQVELDEEQQIVVVLTTDKDKRYRLSISVEAETPHRISAIDWQRLFDFEVVVREATAADGAALAEIERRAPIEMGGSLLTFDRSADYLAAARLMEDAHVMMAEVDGEPAAVEWAALHHTRIGGQDCRLLNFIHLRVAAEHQRKGLWGALVSRLYESFPDGTLDGDYNCAARDNETIQKAFAGRPRWQVGPVRALITARPQTGSPVGREATPDDADLIVELLNAAHGREEMFLPYTRETLCARLERAPELYSWQHLRITDKAVVGVWPSGPQLRVLRESNGRTVENRNGLVLDYGYAAGAEEEFEQLLRHWCEWLAAHEHTQLSIFTSQPSPAYPVIAALSDRLETFDLWTSPMPEPPGAKHHGVYADQVYF